MELKDKNNTNYYRVSYVNGKRKNYRYQYSEDGKMKSVVRNSIEELEMAVKSKGLSWIWLGGNENE